MMRADLSIVDFDTVLRINPNIRFSPYNSDLCVLYHVEHDFRLLISSTVFNILSLLDSDKSINDLKREFELQHSIAISESQIHNLLISDLAGYDVVKIEHHDSMVACRQNELGEIGDYIKFKVRLFSGKFSDRISSALSFLFSRTCLVCMAVLTVVCIVGVVNEWNTIDHSVNSERILSLLLVSAILPIFHEFGHMGACKKVGIPHGGIGFGLYNFFIPVFFADVSHGWDTTKKNRLIINFGGAYLDLISTLILAAALIWSRDSAFLYLIYMNLLRMVINLNPFLRYDGYWVLSDLFDCPNLKNRSNMAIKEVIAKRRGKPPLGLGYVVYGILSNLYLLIIMLSYAVFHYLDLLMFPRNLHIFIKSLFSYSIDYTLLSSILIPALMYAFGIQVIYKAIKGPFINFIKLIFYGKQSSR